MFIILLASMKCTDAVLTTVKLLMNHNLTQGLLDDVDETLYMSRPAYFHSYIQIYERISNC